MVSIGLVTFTLEGARAPLAPLATQRFASRLLGAQPGIEILELGTVAGHIDAAAARRLATEHGVRTVIAGHLVVSNVRPRVRVLGGVRASAEANVSLAVRFLNGESGATLWTRDARVQETVAAVAIVDGQTVFGAQDVDEAYGELVDRLVWELTQDFRATWVKR